MIECNMGKLEVCGSEAIVMAEVTLILDKVSMVVAKETGKSHKEVMKQIYNVAKTNMKRNEKDKK